MRAKTKEKEILTTNNVGEKMKYTYAQADVQSVPAPSALTPPISASQTDTLQDLITRKRLAEKNKFKFHLTEADCSLICSNAVEIHYAQGQQICEENEVVTKMYRVKCGTLGLFVGKTKLKEFSKGYFVGEILFIRDEMKPLLPNSRLVAETPVTLYEINLPFIKQLIDVDKVLAFKIYRYLAAKFSAFLAHGLTNVANDPTLLHIMQKRVSIEVSSKDSRDSAEISNFSSESSGELQDEVSTHSHDSSPPSSGSRLSVGSDSGSDIPSSHSSASLASNSSSGSSSNLSEEQIAEATEYSLRIIKGVSNPVRKMKRPKQNCCKQAKLTPFRTFNMESPSGQCLLDAEKIKFTCTIRQRKIKYKQILDVSKIGKNSVTIIYNVQAVSLRQSEEDASEFYNLVQSLRLSISPTPTPSNSASSASSSSTPSTPTTPASPSSSRHVHSSPSIAPLNLQSSSSSSISLQEDQSDKVVLRNLAVRQDLKKGDVLIAEGDLYQRIYTIVSGEFASMKGDRELLTLHEGETIGVLTLFHLRPAMANVVVKSETATVLIIPGYKIQELVSSNFALAVRVYKKAAQLVVGQVEYTLTKALPGVEQQQQSSFL